MDRNILWAILGDDPLNLPFINIKARVAKKKTRVVRIKTTTASTLANAILSGHLSIRMST